MESEVSLKRIYALDGEQFANAEDGSVLAEHTKKYLTGKSDVSVQAEDGDYLVALEGSGSRWLTESQVLDGHELLPESFRNDLLQLASILRKN